MAKGQRGLCDGSSSVCAGVCAPVNSFPVSAIETTLFNQSEPNLHEVFMGTRSQMSLIESEICSVVHELLPLMKIAVFDLVRTIKTTFLNQSGPKLHEVFIGTRSQMSSIMSEIRKVALKLFVLEFLKIAVYVCIFTICLAPTFIDGF